MRYIVLLLMLVGCGAHREYMVEAALDASGNNRKELESVLSHYAVNPRDSLKLRAAEFLIANMPGHFNYDGYYLQRLQMEIDSVYYQQPQYIRNVLLSMLLSYGNTNEFLSRREDILTITSASLIDYIDRTFAFWGKCPWRRNYSFSHFCEYILPYKLFEEQPISFSSDPQLETIRQELLSYFEPYNSYFTGDLESVKWCAIRIANKHLEGLSVSELTLPDMDVNYHFDCREDAMSECALYNALGLPHSYDFAPHWGNRDGRHAWALMQDYTPVFVKTFAKVYRRTFSHNVVPTKVKSDEIIPAFFQDPFNRDVTAIYGRTGTITLDVDRRIRRSFSNLYLAVFNDGEWRPIAWSRMKKNTQFEYLGLDVLYLPICYTQQGAVMASYPIALLPNKTTHLFRPDLHQRQTMKLYRKYPMSINKIEWMDNIDSAVVIGFNQNIAEADTLAVLSPQTVAEGVVALKNPRKYNHITIKSTKMMQFAEITLLDQQGSSIPIAVQRGQGNEEAAIDGDNLTFTLYLKEIILNINSLNTPYSIVVLPRNDDNWVCPGQEYELFWWSMEGWQSCGIKTAATTYLEYADVPSGAVYLLKNHTKGIEHRPFTYENGHVTFW